MKIELNKDSEIVLIVKRDNNPHLHYSDRKQMRLFLPLQFYNENKEEIESIIRDFRPYSYRREKNKIEKLSEIIYYSNSNLIEETYNNIEKYLIKKFSKSAHLSKFFNFIHSLKDKEVSEKISFFTKENIEIDGICVPKGTNISFKKRINYEDDLFNYAFEY